jgi:YVTN family beta-propeller protein
VFTFNGGSDDATAIDANTNKVLGTIPLGGRPEYAAPDGVGMIYDNLADTSQIVAIDARTLTVKSHWPLAPVTDPSGLAMDVINRHLFSVGHNGKMAVLDADTGKVIATPTIGQGPDAARFDLGYEVALSSNGRDGTLTVVQEQTPQVFTPIQTVTTQVGARTMAFDTVTHDLWLITAQFIPVPPGSPANTRPAIQNGTVVLLEFAPTP